LHLLLDIRFDILSQARLQIVRLGPPLMKAWQKCLHIVIQRQHSAIVCYDLVLILSTKL
jgi:hypothetical protein